MTLPSSPIKILGKPVQGLLMSYDRTNKQTPRHPNRDYNFVYIDTCNSLKYENYFRLVFIKVIMDALSLLQLVHQNKQWCP